MMNKIKTKKLLIFICSMIVMILPDFMINSELSTSFFILALISKISLYLFLFILLLKISKSFFKTYFIIGSFYLLSSSVEIITVNLLGSYITLDNMKALFHTSMPEILEFSRGFYFYLLIPAIIFFLFLICLKSFKSFHYKSLSKRFFFFTVILLFLTSTLIPTFLVYNSPLYFSGKNLPKYIFRQYYLKQHPFNFFYRTYELTLTISRFNKYINQKKSFVFGVTNSYSSSMPDIVVLVIGERIRYSNWSINGYKKETSPNLLKIKNLISFENHFSNANSTSNSIPLIITQATPQNPEKAFSQKTIVSLFKEAGYETTWISNQNVFDYIDNRNEVDTVYDLYKEHQNDIDIIPVFLNTINKKSSKKKFIVINMIGGHGKISEEFNYFKPNSLHKNYSIKEENAPILINDYDNMIRSQDFVLSEIINGIEKNLSSSIFLFTSDHGCNLFDGNSNLFGYGSSNPTEKETHVPLFVWTSRKYIEKNILKTRNLFKNKKKLTVNTSVFYTLADMSNINYTFSSKKLSIANSSYLEPISRFVYVNGSLIEFKGNNFSKL